LEGIPGVKNVSDDIITGGRDDAELLSRTVDVFKRLRQIQLTVNPKNVSSSKRRLFTSIGTWDTNCPHQELVLISRKSTPS